MSGIFDTLTETLHGLPGLSLGPGEGGGHDVERWANSLAAFLSAMAGKVSSDSSTICERLPMESSSREDMSNLSTAMIGLAGQVYEHVEQWKNDTSWQYTDNNA